MEKIEHVSDTALMVAACHALETARPDGFTRDPFAARLAGERGMAIARGESAIEWMCFGIGLRSRFIDDLIIAVLRQGRVETVVNLGAGLDSRPWRLDLPTGLRWIESDFNEMLEYKSVQLADERPRCTLQQIAADLSLPLDGDRVFQAVGNRPALMITEGLLMYLPRPALVALSSEAAIKSGIRAWIFDVSSKELMRRAHGDMLRDIENVRASDHLTGREIIDAAVSHGWKIDEFRTYARDAIEIAQDRVLTLAGSVEHMPDPLPEDDPSGVYLATWNATPTV
jgi:methyltransferase (TIGR00027 family)